MAVLGCDKLWHNDISRRKSFRNWDISIKIQRVKLKLQAYNISTQNNQTKEEGKEEKRANEKNGVGNMILKNQEMWTEIKMHQ